MSRRSGLLAVLSGLVLVGLVCGLAWLGLASGQALAGSNAGAVTNAPSAPPDLTGYWHNKYDTSGPPWHLVASNGLFTLDATWTGGPGHTGLRGSSHGSLLLTGGVYDYDGRFTITEAGTTVNGKSDFTIVDANQVTIDITPDGGTRQHYTFVRVGATAQTVPEPAPGATVAVQSPKDLPATANTASVGVSSSSGNLAGDAVAAQGDTKKTIANGIAKFVVWCWLTADLRLGGKPLSPAAQFTACFYLSTMLFPFTPPTLPPNPPPTTAVSYALAVQPDAVLSSAASGGCRELAIPIDVRTRKGKILSIGKDKHAKLNASSVRYTCSVSGGTAKITVKGRKHLRTSLGKRLHLLVVRAKKAPPASGTLTFTFGR